MVTFLSILGILALLGIVATLAAVLTDGYRPVPTEWNRIHDRGDDLPPVTTEPEHAAVEETGAAHRADPVASRRRSARRTRRGARAGAR